MNGREAPDIYWKSLLAEQIARHSRLFFRLAYGVLRDAHAAEDVCQQALLKAWQQRDSIRDAGALRPWIARVVVNESLRIARRRKTEQKVHADCRQQAEMHHGGPEPLLRPVVEEALTQLAEPVRLVVVLRTMNGLKGNEVADLLGCSASEVSRRLHEGLSRLRELLIDVQVEA